MKADTTRRPWRPAYASTLRMKWTRQRCHEACSTLATAALMPSWASEITSLIPRKPRRASLRKNAVQKVSAGSNIHAENFAAAVAVDADRDDHRHRDDAPALAHLYIGGVNPQVGPVAFDRPVQERFHRVVDLFAQPADLALGDAGHAHRLDQVVDRARGDAVHIGFLNNRGERLLG